MFAANVIIDGGSETLSKNDKLEETETIYIGVAELDKRDFEPKWWQFRWRYRFWIRKMRMKRGRKKFPDLYEKMDAEWIQIQKQIDDFIAYGNAKNE